MQMKFGSEAPYRRKHEIKKPQNFNVWIVLPAFTLGEAERNQNRSVWDSNAGKSSRGRVRGERLPSASPVLKGKISGTEESQSELRNSDSSHSSFGGINGKKSLFLPNAFGFGEGQNYVPRVMEGGKKKK